MIETVRASASQTRAISCPWKKKVTLVLSTAGSGKTFVLTHRVILIAKQLLQHGLINKRILCVCFNRSAADEMFDRILQSINEQRLSQKISVTRRSQFSPNSITIEIRTFHSLGLWIIHAAYASERLAVQIPDGMLKILRGKEQKKLVGDILHQQRETSESELPERTLIRSTIENISTFKRRDFDKCCEEYLLNGVSPFTNPKPFRLFTCYEEKLHQQNAIDFDDMIYKSVQLLLKSEDVRKKLAERYETVLVDEFQDISASEMVICKVLIHNSTSITFVGDDDQQIYSFRKSATWVPHKAVVKIFVGSLQILTLPENRRCTGAIVTCAKALISRNSDRYNKGMSAVRSQGTSVSVIGCKNLKLEKKFLSSFLLRLLPHLKQLGERVLILFRLRASLKEFRTWLSDVGISTTTKISLEKKTKPVGSITLRIFSVLCLLSNNLSDDMITWSLASLSPVLDENTINDILLTRISRPSPNSGHENSTSGQTLNKSDNTCLILEALRSHLTQEKRAEYDQRHGSSFQALLDIIKAADCIYVRLRQISNLEELLRHTEASLRIYSSFNDDAMDENSDDEDWDAKDSDIQERRVGFDYMLSIAKRIDHDSPCEVNQSSARVLEVETESSKGDKSDSEDDFAKLFSQDNVSRARKRRKAYGISQVPASQNGTGKDTLARLRRKLDTFQKEVYKKLVSNEFTQKTERRQKDIPQVVLSTIHKAKGSTFSHVILCGADDDTLPYNVTGDQGATLSSSNASNDQVSQAASMHCQEERRLVFVAMTRARHQFLCTYSSRGMGGQIRTCQSRFLGEMQEDLHNRGENCSEFIIEREADISSSGALKIWTGK